MRGCFFESYDCQPKVKTYIFTEQKTTARGTPGKVSVLRWILSSFNFCRSKFSDTKRKGSGERLKDRFSWVVVSMVTGSEVSSVG